jgi:hypothetical protein
MSTISPTIVEDVCTIGPQIVYLLVHSSGEFTTYRHGKYGLCLLAFDHSELRQGMQALGYRLEGVPFDRALARARIEKASMLAVIFDDKRCDFFRANP